MPSMVDPLAADAAAEFRPAAYLTWLAFLTLATIAIFPLPIPSWSEHFYLITPLHLLDPSFLARDWTVANEYRTHLGFTYFAAGLIKVFGLEVAGLIGRILTAALVQSGLLRLGMRMGVPYRLTTLVILLWLACGQSLFGGEWMLRTFEGKAVAYGVLLWSVDYLCAGRWAIAGALAGLAFTFNPAVALIAATGLLAAAITIGGSRRDWTALVSLGLIFCLPGLLGASAAALGGAATADDWALFFIAYKPNLDPTSAGVSRLLLAATMAGFCALQLKDESLPRPVRAWVAFTLGLAIPALAGLAAWATHSYEWLRFFPFRVFPLFLPLVFLLLVARRDFLRWDGMRGRAALMLVVFSLIALPDPVANVVRQLREDLQERARHGEYEQALTWVRGNTPDSALLAVPPDRFDAHTLSRRAVVALWSAPRYDQIHEWRERIESLSGPIRSADDVPALQERFEQLPFEGVERLAQQYGANYLVSAGVYPELVALHRSGSVMVYLLPADAARTPPVPGRAAERKP
jgi:hypothetical protein